MAVPYIKQISAFVGDSGGTHQLHIVDHFVFITPECINGVCVKGERHSLQSLVLGVHADVRLHLRRDRHMNTLQW